MGTHKSYWRLDRYVTLGFVAVVIALVTFSRIYTAHCLTTKIRKTTAGIVLRVSTLHVL